MDATVTRSHLGGVTNIVRVGIMGIMTSSHASSVPTTPYTARTFNHERHTDASTTQTSLVRSHGRNVCARRNLRHCRIRQVPGACGST